MKIGFIGAGKMAEAIIISLLKEKITEPQSIIVSDISKERLSFLETEHNLQISEDNKKLVNQADVIFVSVKPQVLDVVIEEVAEYISTDKLVFSILAGKKIAAFESRLPGVPVVRVMPNLPCQVGEGMTAFCLGSSTDESHKHIAEKLLATFGKVIQLDEDKFDVVTALSGSGPAFFAYLMNCMAIGAEKFGLSPEQAKLLSCQTMLGTAKVLLDKGYDPVDFITAVTSPKGTTEAGRKILENSGIDDILAETIKAAADRSIELSS
jgi:pyrroline-5-carboxylate reductase